jgi:streptogramin lyase
MALCAVCTVHVETRSVGFLVAPENQGQWFVSGSTSKLLGRFPWFDLKTGGDSFLVEPQNQGGGWFSGLDLKAVGYGLVIWTSKSLRRFLGLGLKTKQTSVC